MDLSTIKTEDREVTLLHPKTGEELGLVFQLRSPDSEEVEGVNRAWQNKRLHPKNRNKAITAEELEVLKDNRIKAAVKGWKWTDDDTKLNGEQPEFSPQNLKSMIKDYSWIRDFLADECEDQASFFGS